MFFCFRSLSLPNLDISVFGGKRQIDLLFFVDILPLSRGPQALFFSAASRTRLLLVPESRCRKSTDALDLGVRLFLGVWGGRRNRDVECELPVALLLSNESERHAAVGGDLNECTAEYRFPIQGEVETRSRKRVPSHFVPTFTCLPL